MTIFALRLGFAPINVDGDPIDFHVIAFVDHLQRLLVRAEGDDGVQALAGPRRLAQREIGDLTIGGEN
jgi:hypothetical protein